MQEDNPFKLPSDDKIFAMREEERQRRAEERERVKHLHVWEKVSLSCSRFKCVISEKLEPLTLNTCTRLPRTAASRHSRTTRLDETWFGMAADFFQPEPLQVGMFPD